MPLWPRRRQHRGTPPAAAAPPPRSHYKHMQPKNSSQNSLQLFSSKELLSLHQPKIVVGLVIVVHLCQATIQDSSQPMLHVQFEQPKCSPCCILQCLYLFSTLLFQYDHMNIVSTIRHECTTTKVLDNFCQNISLLLCAERKTPLPHLAVKSRRAQRGLKNSIIWDMTCQLAIASIDAHEVQTMSACCVKTAAVLQGSHSWPRQL